MSGAAKIAEDPLMPTLMEGSLDGTLPALCPYWVGPTTLALFICGFSAGMVACNREGAYMANDQ
jgi:hypothetical protein